MNELISIIVPVYNTDQYLYTCIQSVLQQTYQYFELILVDDGSQDDSAILCKNMCNIDSRIHLISQNHKGIATARNTALKFAKGKYLFFLDSDDAIHPCLLEVLHAVLSKTHSVLAATEYQFMDRNVFHWFSTIPQSPHYCNDYIYINNPSSIDLFVRGYINILYGIGGIMIRRVDSSSLCFDEKLSNGEDTKFIYQLLLHGADTVILNKKWYFYRKHNDNISKSRTIDSCRSMYKCECYIRNNEIKRHRNNNALIKEQILLSRLIDWYIAGKQNSNLSLCKYIKKIARQEWSSENIQHINLYNKISFYLVFHCLPFYWLFIKITALSSLLLHSSVFHNIVPACRFIYTHYFSKNK